MRLLTNYKKVLALLLLSFSFSEQDCDYYNVKLDCNDAIFVGYTGEPISKKKYTDWINKSRNKNILSKYFSGVSSSRTSEDGLIEEARSSLASQISVNISSKLTSLITSETSSMGNDFDSRLVINNMEQFVNETIEDYKIVTVKDADIYTVHVFKCKTAYFEKECNTNNELENYIDNEMIEINKIRNNKNKKNVNSDMRMSTLFSLLIKTYLYTYSSSNINLIDKNSEIKKMIIDEVINPLESIVSTQNNSINRIPYIYYNSNIAIDANALIKGFDNSYIEGFPLYALHNNGISNWEGNKKIINELSNGKTIFAPGMVMSQSSQQNISIHPDHLGDIQEFRKGDYAITDAAISSLTKIIENNPLTIIDIQTNNQLPLKVTFDKNLNNDEQSKILNSINKINNISNYFCMCDGTDNLCESIDEKECFEMNFTKVQDTNKGNITFSTPDKKKTKTKNIKIKSNGISGSERIMKDLYNEIFKSKIKFDFCDDISLFINGDRVYNDDLYINVENGPIDIKIDYKYKGKNVNIYKNQIIVFNDKDLNDLVNETDLFEFKGKQVCYSNRDIDYKIVLTNDDIALKNLIIEWNGKKYKYNTSKKEFQSKDELLFGNPLTINENSLNTNKILIRKNGYNSYYDKNITAPFNYRGEYPYIQELEKNKKFDSLFHYMFNIIIPGKGQTEYYKTSAVSKIRSILTGVASYYLAYQAYSHYQDYDQYNTEFYKYSDLYNNTYNSDDMEFYREQVLLNSELSKDSQNKALQFGFLSGLLFSVNAMEITIIHLDF